MFGQHRDSSEPDNQSPMGNVPEPDGMLGMPALGGDDRGMVSSAGAGSTSPIPAMPAPTFRKSLPLDDAADTADDVPAAAAAGQSPSDLIGIKQNALQQLRPLVGHLDQTPEEKFRTTMMMIQAADDQSLINEAYEAAKNISDEKARAQALLDVVNEINYFTSQNTQN